VSRDTLSHKAALIVWQKKRSCPILKNEEKTILWLLPVLGFAL
jgi:hypothetical protein